MRASAVGIDLGSSRTVIAAAIGGGVKYYVTRVLSEKLLV